MGSASFWDDLTASHGLGAAKAAPKLCARDLVTEAIRLARQNKPRADITGSSRRASTSDGKRK